MRIARTVALFLVPLVIAVAVNEATTTPGDANIGGGIVMLVAIGVGIFFGVESWHGGFSWTVLAIGAAVLGVAVLFTFGGEALEDDNAKGKLVAGHVSPG